MSFYRLCTLCLLSIMYNVDDRLWLESCIIQFFSHKYFHNSHLFSKLLRCILGVNLFNAISSFHLMTSVIFINSVITEPTSVLLPFNCFSHR